jgi:cAMP phosphodiesterase
MRVRLLPSNLSEPSKYQPLTTMLINDVVAVDGGCIGYALGPEAQRQVRSVIITHSHIDHVATLPVFIAENFPFLHQPISVYSTRETIEAMKVHIFNDKIWPDFARIRLFNGNGSGLHYVEIKHLLPFEVEGLRITPVWTNHTVPTTGLAIEDSMSSIIFTADTYHTEEIWHLANRMSNLRAVLVDVSYPNELEQLASDSKHLTPQGLAIEMRKLDRDIQVYAVHLKPQSRERIIGQLEALGRPNIAIGEINREYVF